jgi:hypothetical protein
MVDMLKERGAHIRVFGGGGGTITPEEIAELQAYGVERIYHPNDGMHMGLVQMIEDVVRRANEHRLPAERPAKVTLDDEISVGKMLTTIEEGMLDDGELARLRKEWQLAGSKTPVLGLTNRRRGQVQRGRRARAALPAEFSTNAHCGARGRPDAPALRRRAARRPHPHEFAAQQARVHALDGDAPPARGDVDRAQGLHRVPQRPGLRPRHRHAGIGQSDSEIVDPSTSRST